MEMKSNAVCWFEIYVNDMERAKKFYSTMLDVAIVDAPEMAEMPEIQMAFFPWVENAPNANGALVKMKGFEVKPTTTPGTMIYFQCDDCAVEESRVVAAGGTVHQSKFSIGDHGFCAVCIDTEGNTFGLHSLK